MEKSKLFSILNSPLGRKFIIVSAIAVLAVVGLSGFFLTTEEHMSLNTIKNIFTKMLTDEYEFAEKLLVAHGEEGIKNLELFLKLKGATILNLMSAIGVNYLPGNRDILDKYVQAIAMDRDVVYAVYLDDDGKVLTSIAPEPQDTKDCMNLSVPIELKGVGSPFVQIGLLGTAKLGLSMKNTEQAMARIKDASEKEIASRKEQTNKTIKNIENIIFGEIGKGVFYVVALVLIIVSLLAFAMSFVFTKVILNPLKKLQGGIEAIASGDLDHKVELKTKDEMGSLAASFNQMGAQLKEVREKLVRSEKLSTIGQLASTVAHELRSPFQMLKDTVTYFEALPATKDNPEIRKNIETMSREMEDSERIIGDLLNFARIRKPSLEMMNVNGIVGKVMGRLKVSPRLKVTTNLTDKLPNIEVDPLQIQQVFYNIARNGLEAMETKGQELKISTRLKDNFVEVSFQDEGVGVPKKNFSKMFEPLFSTKLKGTGLGLALCASLVESHGGRIDFDSEVGKGTTFTVKLPVKK